MIAIAEHTETTGLIDQQGRYDIPEVQYHADPLRHLGGSLSSTIARKLLPPSCPKLARHAMDHPGHKDAYDLGSVTHRLILGRGCPIVDVPADSWSTKAAKEARADARAAGKVALLSKDLATAIAMRDAVRSDMLAAALLSIPGMPEQTLIWREGGTWSRAMLDYWPDPNIDAPIAVDIKTTDDVSDEHLTKTIWQYGYHQQEDWYRRGYYAVHGVYPEFVFIFVRKTPPHLVRLVQLDAELRRYAWGRNDDALDVWRQCQKSGDWPAYPPRNDFTLIGPPRWVRGRDDL